MEEANNAQILFSSPPKSESDSGEFRGTYHFDLEKFSYIDKLNNTVKGSRGKGKKILKMEDGETKILGYNPTNGMAEQGLHHEGQIGRRSLVYV